MEGFGGDVDVHCSQMLGDFGAVGRGGVDGDGEFEGAESGF